MTKPPKFHPHHFLDTAYGPVGKRLTLGVLEALCADARAGGASSAAVVDVRSSPFDAVPSLRITWSD